MENLILNPGQVHGTKSHGLRISVSPARQSQIVNSPTSPARSITDAIKSGSHKTLFATATEHQEQLEQQMSEDQGLDFGLTPKITQEDNHDHDSDKLKPHDVGMHGLGNQSVFDMDSSDAEDVDKGEKKTVEHHRSPKSSAMEDGNIKQPAVSVNDLQVAGSTDGSNKPDTEGLQEFLKLGPHQLGPHQMHADPGIGIGFGPESSFNSKFQSQYANYPQYHAHDSNFQPSFEDIRPTSDGTLFNGGYEHIVYPTEDLRRQYQNEGRGSADPDKTGRLDRFNIVKKYLEGEENIAIAKYNSKKSRRTSKRPKSATGRTTPKDFDSNHASNHDDRRIGSAVAPTKGILRPPAFVVSPTPLTASQSKRRSMSSPTPPLPQALTPPVPAPPSDIGSNVGSLRRQSTIPPNINTNLGSRSTAVSAAPLHTPFPFEQVDGDKAPDDPSPDTQPKSATTPSQPRVHITEPAIHLRHSIANSDLRRKSRAISVSVSSDTILALSARRRYAPSGRVVTRLVVPADTELAYPAISRRTSQAQGRRMSTATTNPDSNEKPEEPSNKKASDFDDGALFRSIRKAYYNELLGTNIASRLWRRYLSARTLKRITLLNGSLSSHYSSHNSPHSHCPCPLRDAESGHIIRRSNRGGLTETMSESKLLSHFRTPNQGRARYAWVAWIHRIAVEVDEDNEEFAARLEAGNKEGEKQRLTAIAGGLEFVEGWSLGRCLVAGVLVVGVSVVVCVVFVVRGPWTAGGRLTMEVTRGRGGGGGGGLGVNDAEGRVVAGAILGVLMFWMGSMLVGLWAWASWLDM